LDQIATPPATDTWFPLSHSQVLGSVVQTLDAAGFGVKSMALAVTADDARFPEITLVPLPRGCDLLPPFGRKFVLPERESPAMPEIPVDENRKPSSTKHDVGAAG
jgi:hypothetical protein